MDNSPLALRSPATVNRTVSLRRPNAELRTREHLTKDEVERLIETAGANRAGGRDGLMILLAFRHGLRASEVCDLRWEQVDFKAATLHVRRTKNGTPATHPLTGRELRGLRRHQRDASPGAFVFVSERGAPLCAPASHGWSSALGGRRSLGLRSTRICSAMPVASRWRTRGMIPAPCKPTWAMRISRTPRDTRPWPKGGSRGFGRTSAARRSPVYRRQPSCAGAGRRSSLHHATLE
jgi:integrase